MTKLYILCGIMLLSISCVSEDTQSILLKVLQNPDNCYNSTLTYGEVTRNVVICGKDEFERRIGN